MARNSNTDLLGDMRAGASEMAEDRRRKAEDDARKQWLLEGDKPAEEGMVPIEVNYEGVEQDLDLVRMAADDQREGRTRPPRSYSPRYLQPKRRTVRGIDLATGIRELDRGSVDNPEIEQDVQAGVELLRQSEVTPEGVDEKGIQGLARVARSIINDGGDYQEYKRAVEMYGAPPKVAQMAYNVAQEAIGQQALTDGYAAPITDADVQAVMANTEEYDEQSLLLEDNWVDSAKVLWEAENGEKWDGTRKELWQYGLEIMSQFNNRVAGAPGLSPGSMAHFTLQAMSRSPFDDNQYAKALYMLLDMYDRTSIGLNTVGRGLGAAFTDPISMLGLGVLGKVSYKIAGNRIKRMLSEAGLVGAIEGGAFLGTDELGRQQTAVEAGAQEEIDTGQVAAYTGAGALMGGFVGKGMDFALSEPMIQRYKNWGRKLVDNAQRGPVIPISPQMGAIGNLRNVLQMSGVSDMRASQIKKLWQVIDGGNRVGDKYDDILLMADPDDYRKDFPLGAITAGRSPHDKVKGAAKLVAQMEKGAPVTPAVMNRAYKELSSIPEFKEIMDSDVPADVIQAVNTQRSVDAMESAFQDYVSKFADNTQGPEFSARRAKQLAEEEALNRKARAENWTDEHYAEALLEAFTQEVKRALSKINDASIESELQDPNVTTLAELFDAIRRQGRDFEKGDAWVNRKIDGVKNVVVLSRASESLPDLSDKDIVPQDVGLMRDVKTVLDKALKYASKNSASDQEVENYIRDNASKTVAEEALATYDVYKLGGFADELD